MYAQLNPAVKNWREIMLDKFNDNVIRKRIPIRSILQLTYKCNFKCVHCYQTPLKGNERLELNTEECKKIIKILKNNGCVLLTFTGGEVFTRADFMELYSYAYDLNLKISIISNGFLINKDIITLFSKKTPTCITVTIYGNSDDTYDNFTRAKYGNNKVWENIENIHSAGIPIRTQIIANSIILPEISDIREKLTALHIPVQLFGRMRCDVDGGYNPYLYQISASQLFNIMSETERKEKMLSFNSKKKACNSGISNAYINPYGEMYLCEKVRENAYSLLQYGFEFCWEKIGELRKSEIDINYFCCTCKYNLFCGLCAPLIKNEYGDAMNEPVNECKRNVELREKLYEYTKNIISD